MKEYKYKELTQNIHILIDGLPVVGRVAGILTSRISLASVERIEIVKGASSSLYGSEALGVMNIITTKGKDEALRKGFIISMALIILKIF